ncbi:MAG: type II toxin-antitoxin system VapC family toxin [Nitrososphaerales archaeon]
MIYDASALYILLKKRELSSLRGSVTLDLAFYEVGNSLLMELRRKLITAESFTNALAVVTGIGELMDVRNFRQLDAGEVARVSRLTGLTFYDASYLTLALMLKDTLATNDKDLIEEARKLRMRTVSI